MRCRLQRCATPGQDQIGRGVLPVEQHVLCRRRVPPSPCTGKRTLNGRLHRLHRTEHGVWCVPSHLLTACTKAGVRCCSLTVALVVTVAVVHHPAGAQAMGVRVGLGTDVAGG